MWLRCWIAYCCRRLHSRHSFCLPSTTDHWIHSSTLSPPCRLRIACKHRQVCHLCSSKPMSIPDSRPWGRPLSPNLAWHCLCRGNCTCLWVWERPSASWRIERAPHRRRRSAKSPIYWNTSGISSCKLLYCSNLILWRRQLTSIKPRSPVILTSF